jgi:hypothetical protein
VFSQGAEGDCDGFVRGTDRSAESLSRCPFCRAEVFINPLLLFGDATCQECGSLLWFPNVSPQLSTYGGGHSRSRRIRAVGVVAKQLSGNLAGADSLGTVEAIVELGDGFDRQEEARS